MTIEIQGLEREYFEPAFELAARTFAASSTIHRALNIGLSEYRDYLRGPFEKMVSEGLSVAAFDPDTEELVGCLVVTDFALSSADSSDPPRKFGPLVALTSEMCRQYKSKRSVTVCAVRLLRG